MGDERPWAPCERPQRDDDAEFEVLGRRIDRDVADVEESRVLEERRRSQSPHKASAQDVFGGKRARTTRTMISRLDSLPDDVLWVRLVLGCTKERHLLIQRERMCSTVCLCWIAGAWHRPLYEARWPCVPFPRPGNEDAVLRTIPPGRPDPSTHFWKKAFGRRMNWEINWTKGHHSLSTIDASPVPALSVQADRQKVVIGCADRRIRIVDLSTKSTKVIIGHKNAIWALQYDNEHIISGSGDSFLKVWDVESMECLRTLCGHNGEVWCLQFDADKIVSGDAEGIAKVWDREKCAPISSIKCCPRSLFSLCFEGDLLVCGTGDKNAYVYDLRAGGLARTMEGHRESVFACILQEGRMVTGSGDKLLVHWDLGSGRPLGRFVGHEDSVWCCALQDRNVISGSVDRTVRTWNLDTYSEQHAFPVLDQVFGLSVEARKVVASTGDGTIYTWDFSHASPDPGGTPWTTSSFHSSRGEK